VRGGGGGKSLAGLEGDSPATRAPGEDGAFGGVAVGDGVNHGRTPKIDFVMTAARLPHELVGAITPAAVLDGLEASTQERHKCVGLQATQRGEGAAVALPA
jgi:hypothetical protein